MLKYDAKGRPYLSSHLPEGQLLAGVSSEHAWDEFGPSLLVSFRNDSDLPTTLDMWVEPCLEDHGRYVRIAIKDNPRLHGSLDMSAVIQTVTNQKQQAAERDAEIAAFAAGLLAGVHVPHQTVDFTPAYVTLASVAATESAISVAKASDEEGAFLDSTGALFDNKSFVVPPHSKKAGALIITGVDRNENLLVEMMTKPSPVNPQVRPHLVPLQLVQQGRAPLPISYSDRFACERIRN